MTPLMSLYTGAARANSGGLEAAVLNLIDHFHQFVLL